MEQSPTLKIQCYLIGLDFETTGLTISPDQKGDEIIQVGGIVMGLVVSEETKKTQICSIAQKEFQEFVCAKKSISDKAQQITGISQEQIGNANTIVNILKQFVQWIDNECALKIERHLIAYNGKNFDLRMLTSELMRQGFSQMDFTQFISSMKITYFCDPLEMSKKFIDTTLLSQNKFGTAAYSMGDVYAALFSKPLENAHNALADVRGMFELMQHNIFLSPFTAAIEKASPNNEYIFAFSDLMATIWKSMQQKKLNSGKKSKTAPAGCLSILQTLKRNKILLSNSKF